jgi:pyruvate dehydrogenase E2 component (dihydrolipoamide acetyltransferase)
VSEIMPIEITIPRLGWSMEEGTFGEWLKAAGEFVLQGEMLFLLEGEKAAQEIEALDSGTLHIPADAPRAGDVVRVGQIIGFLLVEGESPPTTVGLSSAIIADTQKESTSRQRMPVDSVPRVRTVATPRARRTALELNVDWEQIVGTGRQGRIRERDVVAFAAQAGRQDPGESAPLPRGKRHPTPNTRLAIARRMLAGVHDAAPVTLFTKADAWGLVAFRETLKSANPNGIIPSYQDIILKLLAAALPECPLLNACWHENGVWVYDEINVAMAVDTPNGLLAPVVHRVDQLSLEELAVRSRELIELARAGKLSPDQLHGGTITVTNLGMFDVDYFTPILNLPQSAILGLGRIVREPVVQGQAIQIGERMGLSLTFDHRVIDGAPAARWLQRLCQLIGTAPHATRFADDFLDPRGSSPGSG